jgi:hypothetical protein
MLKADQAHSTIASGLNRRGIKNGGAPALSPSPPSPAASPDWTEAEVALREIENGLAALEGLADCTTEGAGNLRLTGRENT